MRKLLMLTGAFLVLTAGCAVDTKRATNVTSTSATLNASVRCDAGSRATAWWELRKAGSAWQVSGAKGTFGCPAPNRTLRVSKGVMGPRPFGSATRRYS
jgi:hypothetical protein